MAQVHLPRALTALVPGLPLRVELDAQAVQELIAKLDQRWAGLANCLCNSHMTLRPHINVYVDGERAMLSTMLHPRSVVRVLMAVSGG